MSVSGSNQGVRFGVATSSNRPATPFDGQVIYETDTDRTLVWNDSAWVAVGYAVYTSSTRPSSPYEGQLIYETDTASVASWNGSAWVYTHSSGLVLVKSQTIGSAVSSVTVTNAFSATYDNYVVTVTGGSQSAPGFMALTLGATVTGYFADGVSTGSTWAGTLTGAAVSNGASLNAVRGAVNTLDGRFEIYSPNLAKVTTFRVNYVRADTGGSTSQYLGFLNNSTQYTDFTLTCNTGSATGGNIRVYGYRN